MAIRRRPAGRDDGTSDGDVLVLEQEHFPVVKSAHVVPVIFQRAWAVDRQVNVHVDGAPECLTMNVEDAATRRRYWRTPRTSRATPCGPSARRDA